MMSKQYAGKVAVGGVLGVSLLAGAYFSRPQKSSDLGTAPSSSTIHRIDSGAPKEAPLGLRRTAELRVQPVMIERFFAGANTLGFGPLRIVLSADGKIGGVVPHFSAMFDKAAVSSNGKVVLPLVTHGLSHGEDLLFLVKAYDGSVQIERAGPILPVEVSFHPTNAPEWMPEIPSWKDDLITSSGVRNLVVRAPSKAAGEAWLKSLRTNSSAIQIVMEFPGQTLVEGSISFSFGHESVAQLINQVKGRGSQEISRSALTSVMRRALSHVGISIINPEELENNGDFRELRDMVLSRVSTIWTDLQTQEGTIEEKLKRYGIDTEELKADVITRFNQHSREVSKDRDYLFNLLDTALKTKSEIDVGKAETITNDKFSQKNEGRHRKLEERDFRLLIQTISDIIRERDITHDVSWEGRKIIPKQIGVIDLNQASDLNQKGETVAKKIIQKNQNGCVIIHVGPENGTVLSGDEAVRLVKGARELHTTDQKRYADEKASYDEQRKQYQDALDWLKQADSRLDELTTDRTIIGRDHSGIAVSTTRLAKGERFDAIEYWPNSGKPRDFRFRVRHADGSQRWDRWLTGRYRADNRHATIELNDGEFLTGVKNRWGTFIGGTQFFTNYRTLSIGQGGDHDSAEVRHDGKELIEIGIRHNNDAIFCFNGLVFRGALSLGETQEYRKQKALIDAGAPTPPRPAMNERQALEAVVKEHVR